MYVLFENLQSLMDFKNRFQVNKPQDRNKQSHNNIENNQRTINNSFGRNTAQTKQSQGGALNRFKRKTLATGNAPAGQFKKYMLEANNIFYQNRPEKRKLEQMNKLKWLLIFTWIALASSYFLINRIKPFQGECPPQARCGVFVHCPQFFEYHQPTNTCVLSNDILLQIQSVSQSQVRNLQYAFGDNECSQHNQIPSLNLRDLFPDVKDQIKRRYYQASSRQFFSNPSNQKNFGFKLQGDNVIPTVKRYSMGCRIQLFLSDPHRQLDITYMVAGLVLFGIVFVWYSKKRRISKMYEFLRQRVLTAPDQILNVTHTMTDLESEFGMMDQKTWDKINEVRTSYRQIGFYEDDFLYWKKM